MRIDRRTLLFAPLTAGLAAAAAGQAPVPTQADAEIDLWPEAARKPRAASRRNGPRAQHRPGL